LDEFISTQEANEDTPKNEIDYRKHFTNWVSIQIDKQNTKQHQTIYEPKLTAIQ
jgi:hypothetical protein